jgi:hypothetical protein
MSSSARPTASNAAATAAATAAAAAVAAAAVALPVGYVDSVEVYDVKRKVGESAVGSGSGGGAKSAVVTKGAPVHLKGTGHGEDAAPPLAVVAQTIPAMSASERLAGELAAQKARYSRSFVRDTSGPY